MTLREYGCVSHGTADYYPCASCKTIMLGGYFCDWPLTGPKAGTTCDRLCCRFCRKDIGDKDYCLAHYQKILDGQTPITPPKVHSAKVRTVCMAYMTEGEQQKLEAVRPGDAFVDVSRYPSIIMDDCEKAWAIEPNGGTPIPNDVWGAVRISLPVGGHVNDHLTDEEFVEQMRFIYRERRPIIDALLSRDNVLIGCYCLVESFCRRITMAEVMTKLGATYTGEVALADLLKEP